MRRQIIQTSDGSTTIHLPDWDESYHSKFGAIQEAVHVFIQNGFSLFEGKSVSILEIGFGTGLNAFLTFLEAEKNKQSVDYVGVEAYPVSNEEIEVMNYAQEMNVKDESFQEIHQGEWEIKNQLSDYFALTKRKQFFHEIEDVAQFDLIYFDAFGFKVQPELWSVEIFKKMYDALKPNGVLVTYAARGVVKRNMIEVGFSVEKLAGPPGKREMFRARKNP
jgi:tRNA U34 5-methylaminomethyl-2-thiouridine-forming methyltransferase MnmC